MTEQSDYYGDIIDELYNKYFLKEGGLTETSDYWQRKGAEATPRIGICS